VAANLLAVLVLSLSSGLLVLAVAYLVVYGVTPWGLADYTRLVGQVFDPVTAPAVLLKTVLFGVAVACAPVAAALDAPRRAASGSEMRVMARLLLFLVAIEGSVLVLLHF
jgi:phospholipid/cholesterol/gamma-HCH transport system permease protein